MLLNVPSIKLERVQSDQMCCTEQDFTVLQTDMPGKSILSKDELCMS